MRGSEGAVKRGAEGAERDRVWVGVTLSQGEVWFEEEQEFSSQEIFVKLMLILPILQHFVNITTV